MNPKPESPCASCGRSAPPVIHWPVGPVCRSCYIRVRGHPAPCESCGNVRALIAVDEEGRGTCGPCAGSAIDYLCQRCGGGEERFRGGLCVRCVVSERLHEQFAGPDGLIPLSLQPLVTLLSQAERPRSVMEWLRRDNGGAQVLRELAAAGVEPTHEALDAVVPAVKVNPLRHTLVHLGALPERNEPLARIPIWLTEVAAPLPERQRQLLHTYVHWHLLRRARRRTERGRQFTDGSGRVIRARVNAAIAFLQWLTVAQQPGGRARRRQSGTRGRMARWW
ncbi:MAG: hypothetical protein K0S96_2248 [Geminicoccaceae bacterium]|nr:hypothetical protein [Geminicoccaceae bacterium]